MKTNIVLTAAIVTLGLFVKAETSCPRGELLGQLENGSQKLTACGTKTGNTLNDLEISSPSNNNPIFQSDDAIKTYQIEVKPNSFHIQESLAEKDFKPFIEIAVSCNKKTCTAVDKKCLWKKSPPDKNVMKELQQALQNKNCDQFDSLQDKAFEQMLNGDKDAFAFFAKDLPKQCRDGAFGERFKTFSQDAKRLKKLRCI